MVLILEKREAKKVGEAEPSSTPSTSASPTNTSASANSLTSPNSAASISVAEDKKDTYIAVLAGTVDRLIQRLTEDVDGKNSLIVIMNIFHQRTGV